MHWVEARLANYVTARRELQVASGQTLLVHIALPSALADGERALVDGRPADESPSLLSSPWLWGGVAVAASVLGVALVAALLPGSSSTPAGGSTGTILWAGAR